MVIQALTAQRATVHVAKATSSAGQRTTFAQKAGKPISVSAQITGEQMWHFLSTLVSVVLPRIKDYKGMNVKAADRSGNVQLGLTPEVVGNFPEVNVNYDA
jgi:large subunit ribosomal protein L5